MNDDDKNTLEENLIRVGIYIPEDLTLNLSGQLSEWQSQKLWWSACPWLLLGGIDLVLIIAVWGVYLLNFWGRPAHVAIFWSVLLLIFALPACFFAIPLLKDIKTGAVKRVSGPLSKHLAQVRPGKTGQVLICYIRIHNLVFNVSPKVYDQTVEHQTYHIFYAPHARKIVNLVPL